LPEIGHACGHNLIATASFAGFLAVSQQLKVSGLPGRVKLLGTPAEEEGGGKIALLDRKAYDGVDACLMAHPSPLYQHPGGHEGTAYQRTLAIQDYVATFKGETAHAGAAPWEGRNALDAAVNAYVNISTMRQQIHPDDRVHCIITNGGTKTNIIPDQAVLECAVRSPTLSGVMDLEQRLMKCLEAGASSAGCELAVTSNVPYADTRPNKTMCRVFTEEMDQLGCPVWCDLNDNKAHPASTDQGNVSYVVPAFQPSFGLLAGHGSSNHTRGFTEVTGTEDAFQRTLIVAKGLAATAWSILSNDQIARQVKDDFDEDGKARGTRTMSFSSKGACC
jgi:amidohydrolase